MKYSAYLRVGIVAIAAVMYVLIVSGLGAYWTADALFDMEMSFDHAVATFGCLEKSGVDRGFLKEHVLNFNLWTDNGGVIVFEDGVVTAATWDDEPYLKGRTFADLGFDPDNPVLREGRTLEMPNLFGRSYVRLCNFGRLKVVPFCSYADVMWVRDRSVLWTALSLFVVLVVFVTLVLRQMSTSARLKVYIADEQRRFAVERSTAAEIQLSALPCTFPPFPDVFEADLRAAMKPAKEVGGDFYDFFRLKDGRIVFLVADVTGKGVPAAMFMMDAKTMLKTLISLGVPLSEAITRASATLKEGNRKRMMVSVWVGVLDPRSGEVEFVNAGHNPPIRVFGGRTKVVRAVHGPMLAAICGARYGSGCLTLRPGERLLLYTDGITEAHDPKDGMFGEGRLLALAALQDGIPLEEVCERVCRAADEFASGRDQFDDMTVLALDYRGVPEFVERMFPCKVAEVGNALSFVEDELDARKVANASRLSAAADEIISNIVKFSEAKSFSVALDVRGGDVRIRFSDDGRRWNPLESTKFDPKADPRSRAHGGMGLWIVRQTMSAVSYAFRDGRNELTVVMVGEMV